MATLGEIRKRSGLLLAVIGFAMLAFILTDFMSSLGSGGGGSIYVGEVFGEEVMRQDYEERVDEGIDNWKSQNQQSILTQSITGQIRLQIWNQYVRELVMNNEYSKLGINISDDEFFELLQGVNVHPEISKVPAFQDPNTGEFDRIKVLGYLKQIDQDQTGEARSRWLGFQKYLIGLIKVSKYNALVSKAMYATDYEAKMNLNENIQSATFNYVAVPFNIVPDSVVEPTESELENYYATHINDFQQPSSNDVEFVQFNVVPSAIDDEATRLSAEGLKADFAVYDDYELMARRNSDNTSARFTFANENELEDRNWLELFFKDEGTVIGPYKYSNGVYRIARLAVAQDRPDSVEARHILIKPTQSMDLDSVMITIELLKSKIENGIDFSDLAQRYSEDKGSAIKGGELGWFKEGTMVNEFNEACFISKKGDISIVNSQFGVHLIQVTKISKVVRKVKIAFIDRNVEPSTETFNSYYTKAAQFAGKILNEGMIFDSLVAQKNFIKRSDSKVTIDKQNIVGLPNSREMVRWTFNNDEGDISEVFQFDDSYVVAYLKKKYDEGSVPLDEINEQIYNLVLNDKKAKYITQSIKNNGLDQIANNHQQSIVYSKTATLSNLSIEGVGYEPELVGAIFAYEISDISRPIEGKNAVYVVEITAKNDVQNYKEFNKNKNQLQQAASNYSVEAAYNTLNTDAEVVDNRSEFY